jgi:Peptidase_C39 like family
MRIIATLLFSLATSVMAASTVLPGLKHEYQRLNNCGPVTAKMTLSLYGISVTQAAAANALKTSTRDRNVTVPEVGRYLERFGFRTLRRWAGSPDQLRRLVAAGFPVVLHQQMKLTDDIGHYRVAYGFDAAGVIVGDSFLGPRLKLSNRDLETLWTPYAGEYLIAYKPNREAALRLILGTDWDRTSNLRRLERESAQRARQNPNDALAWWGLGIAQLALGDSNRAANAFVRSQTIGLQPRHYWYQQDAFEAWNRVGRYDLTLKVAARALRAYPTSFEIGLRYAQALEGLGQRAAAQRAYRAVLVEAPKSAVALRALAGGVGGEP